MNLADILQGDDKEVEDRRLIHQKYCDAKDYIDKLVELIETGQCLSDTTWLLKAALEANGKIEPLTISRIYSNLATLENWQQKLHILQCMEYMPVANPDKKPVEYFLRQCLCDDNKFVRAWAYSGFYYMATQHEEFQPEAIHFFELALKDEAASVKARVRKLKKQGFNK